MCDLFHIPEDELVFPCCVACTQDDFGPYNDATRVLVVSVDRSTSMETSELITYHRR